MDLKNESKITPDMEAGEGAMRFCVEFQDVNLGYVTVGPFVGFPQIWHLGLYADQTDHVASPSEEQIKIAEYNHDSFGWRLIGDTEDRVFTDMIVRSLGAL